MNRLWQCWVRLTSASLAVAYMAILELRYHIMLQPARKPAGRPWRLESLPRSQRRLQFTSYIHNIGGHWMVKSNTHDPNSYKTYWVYGKHTMVAIQCPLRYKNNAVHSHRATHCIFMTFAVHNLLMKARWLQDVTYVSCLFVMSKDRKRKQDLRTYRCMYVCTVRWMISPH